VLLGLILYYRGARHKAGHSLAVTGSSKF
jgi:hypothetical protein